VDLAAMRTETMMGTPHYISPEQIRSTRDVDHRTDLWSLGAVMFEVLSGGGLPFREEREVTALIAEVLERPHRSLLDIAPNVPERLAAIVDRCLEKDRDFRYQTAAEVALDLFPLAPARARASVERAVTVMQAAGLMPLNGDMESLRPMPAPHSDRLGGSPAAPISGRRLAAEVNSASGAVSVQPVVVTRSAPVLEPLPVVLEDRGHSRARTARLAAFLIACCLLLGVVVLGTRMQLPNFGSMPQHAAAIRRIEPAPPVTPFPEVSVTPSASGAVPSVASAARKPPWPKALSRPAAPRQTAKAAAQTSPDPTPPPPPQNRLELRRER